MRCGAGVLLLALAVLVRAALAAGGPPAPIRVTILHTNDIHGWIMPRPAAFYEKDPARLAGGAASLAAYVRKVKGPKLLVDAGDWFQGTPEGGLQDGRAIAEVFNAAGYDLLTVGNHEFDNGERNLRGIIRAIKAPVLCSNIYGPEGRRIPECEPRLVKEVAGVKIGFVGLLTTKMKDLSVPDNIAGLSFRRTVDEAKDAVAALRREGATVIIAISHQGFESPHGPPFEGDQTLAAQVEGIDLIVGGHSHTVLKDGLLDAAHGTLIAQTGAELTRVGEVSLEIDPRTKKVVRSSARLVDLWPDETGRDPAVAAVVAKLTEEVGRAYDVVLATSAVPLTRNRDGESSLGDWMADCERSWAGSDLALINGGGIRADIPPGPVTLRHIYDVMPFDNRMVKLVMKGRDVKAMLDQGLGQVRINQISGASVSYRRKAPPGRRVESVSIAGRPLVEESTYTVTTIDFLVRGNDGFSAFDFAEKKEFTKTLLRDLLSACARKDALLKTPPAGRLVPLGD